MSASGSCTCRCELSHRVCTVGQVTADFQPAVLHFSPAMNLTSLLPSTLLQASSGQVRSLQVPPPFAFEPRKPIPTLHACLASAASCRLLRAINAVIHQLKAHPGAKTAVICPQLHDEILETWQLGPNIVRPAPALALVVGGANGGHGGSAAWF